MCLFNSRLAKADTAEKGTKVYYPIPFFAWWWTGRLCFN